MQHVVFQAGCLLSVKEGFLNPESNCILLFKSNINDKSIYTKLNLFKISCETGYNFQQLLLAPLLLESIIPEVLGKGPVLIYFC